MKWYDAPAGEGLKKSLDKEGTMIYHISEVHKNILLGGFFPLKL